MEYVYCRSNSPSCSYVRHCILTAPLFILELIEVLVDKTVKGKLLGGGVGGGWLLVKDQQPDLEEQHYLLASCSGNRSELYR